VFQDLAGWGKNSMGWHFGFSRKDGQNAVPPRDLNDDFDEIKTEAFVL
jgi:hypothetical protein